MRIQEIGAAGMRVLMISALALGFSASDALANFRGGGALFGFTQQCEALGVPQGRILPVRARYVDVAADANPRPSSEVTMTLPDGAWHIALWGRSMAPTQGRFLGAAGRTLFTVFSLSTNRPLVSVVLRSIVTRIDPQGPETLENARSVMLRLRIQNFSGVQGCSATFAAAMRRP